MLKIVEGDLLESTETFLCHQTNCTSKYAAHLAKTVFDKYPYANIYMQRAQVGSVSQPGVTYPDGLMPNQRPIIHMMGQIFPGKATGRTYKSLGSYGADTYENRLWWFASCLAELRYYRDYKKLQEKFQHITFAMPYRIGCGAAGGNWDDYLDYIQKFSSGLDITLYRYDK